MFALEADERREESVDLRLAGGGGYGGGGGGRHGCLVVVVGGEGRGGRKRAKVGDYRRACVRAIEWAGES